MGTRLRDLGITVGTLPPGRLNAMTDIAGIRVGHVTLIEDTPRRIRTGVTAIWPTDDLWRHAVFAGVHSFNGSGELCGGYWIEESGLLSSPICLTSTYSVGVVRDALLAIALDRGRPEHWHLGVVGETYDGWLSDGGAMAVDRSHVEQALDSAVSGLVPEGAVGGGTGMICHQFKGGIGSASRVVDLLDRPFLVGVLVQANYGLRGQLRVDGIPVGREITAGDVPVPQNPASGTEGSIIVVVATDAPLLPVQCKRLARRATAGLARVGGIGNNGSGDLFLAFSTGNLVPAGEGSAAGSPFSAKGPVSGLVMLPNQALNPLFEATAEATEEAILNALCAADTMTGWQDRTVHALPHDRLQAIVSRYPWQVLILIETGRELPRSLDLCRRCRLALGQQPPAADGAVDEPQPEWNEDQVSGPEPPPAPCRSRPRSEQPRMS